MDNLPILFSQLDQQYCKEQLELLRLNRNGDIIDTNPLIKNEDFIEQTIKIYQSSLAEAVFLDKKGLVQPTVI